MADGAACLGLGSGLRDTGRSFPEYRSSLESQARARHYKRLRGRRAGLVQPARLCACQLACT